MHAAAISAGLLLLAAGGAQGRRAFLLLGGGQLVPIACVDGRRSLHAHACNAGITADPHVSIVRPDIVVPERVSVEPAIVTSEHERVSYRGFALTGTQGTGTDSAALNGCAVWPAGAFAVELSPYGRQTTDGGAGKSEAPVWTGPLAREARRQIASVLGRRLENRPLRLLQSVSIDTDGDGKPERVHNVLVENVEGARSEEGGPVISENATDFYFLFIERGGHLVRLAVDSRPSRLDGMDGALLGWFDIDGDGRPEIWLETPRYEGSTTQIVRREGRSLRAVSEFGYQYMGDEVEYHEP